jgi:hypothetical protein
MRTPDSTSTDHLDDTELLAQEQEDRDDFRRRAAVEPQDHGTTDGVARGSPALVAAWERWWRTNLAARMRGILTRTLGR